MELWTIGVKYVPSELSQTLSIPYVSIALKILKIKIKIKIKIIKPVLLAIFAKPHFLSSWLSTTSQIHKTFFTVPPNTLSQNLLNMGYYDIGVHLTTHACRACQAHTLPARGRQRASFALRASSPRRQIALSVRTAPTDTFAAKARAHHSRVQAARTPIRRS